MSDFKYNFKSWANHFYDRYWEDKEITPENMEAYIKQTLNGDGKEIIEYLLSQYDAAEASNEVDSCWVNLKERAVIALRALETSKNNTIFRTAFELGQAAQQMEFIPTNYLTKILQDNVSFYEKKFEEVQSNPIYRINTIKSIIKDFAQEYAQKQWDKDVQQELRLIDMCNIVWSHLLEQDELSEFAVSKTSKPLQDFLPNNPEALKPWLRKVAPNYATKKGRPRAK